MSNAEVGKTTTSTRSFYNEVFVFVLLFFLLLSMMSVGEVLSGARKGQKLKCKPRMEVPKSTYYGVGGVSVS